MKKTSSIVSILALALVGCAGPVPRVEIEKVQANDPIKLSPGKSKKFFVMELTDKLSSLKIGQMTVGGLCMGGTELLWNGNQTVRTTMGSKIRDEFVSNGYAVSTSLLATTSERDADVLVGVALTDVKGNICSSPFGTKGEILAELSWEIFDKGSAQTLLLKSKGTSKLDEFSRTGDPDIYFNAVQNATRNVLSYEEFAKISERK